MLNGRRFVPVVVIFLSLMSLGVVFVVIDRKNKDAAPAVPSAPVMTEVTKRPVVNIKSEIDAYGTDLHALNQGETVKKMGDIVVTYTRDKDSVVRKVTKTSPSGGTSNETVTINLNAQDELVTTISTMEANFVKECQDPLILECLQGKAVLNVLKSSCSAMDKMEDMSRCMANSMLAAQQAYEQFYQFPISSTSRTTDKWGVDLSALSEGVVTKVFNEPAGDGSIMKHTVTYDRSGDTVRINDVMTNNAVTSSFAQEISIAQLKGR